MDADQLLEQDLAVTFGIHPWHLFRKLLNNDDLTRPPVPDRALAKIHVPQYLEWRRRVLEEHNGEAPVRVKSWDLWLMHCVSGIGDIELMKQLMDAGISIRGRAISAGPAIATAGNVEMARFLLEHKADLNIPARSGRTAATWAVRLDDLELMQFLLEHKADPNLNTMDDSLVSNAEYDLPSLRRDLSFNKQGECVSSVDSPWSCVRSAEMAQLLEDAGAEVNQRSLLDNSTPLHEAAGHSGIRTVTLLLAHKADVNAVDCFGHRPFHSSLDSNLPPQQIAAVCRALLEHDADPYAPNGDPPYVAMWGFDPIRHHRGISVVVDVLWDFMVDTEFVYSDDIDTLFMVSARDGYQQLMAYLIDNGCYLGKGDSWYHMSEQELEPLLKHEDYIEDHPLLPRAIDIAREVRRLFARTNPQRQWERRKRRYARPIQVLQNSISTGMSRVVCSLVVHAVTTECPIANF